jgi:photosystem II stability/assembly factor-like uncharacterized protein
MKKFTLLVTILIFGLQSYSQWTPQEINTNAQLTDVFFLNEQMGWVAGNIPPETGIIFKTTNGGITWDSISIVPFGVMELQFVDSLTGWGNLTWNTQEDGLYKTIDGGFTWELMVSGSSEVEFFNENEGVLLDHDNPFPLYSTNDCGGSWDLIDTLTGENISGMGCLDFINANVGFVVKHWQVLNQTGEVLVKTSDGGFTWEEKDCPDYAQSLFFINEENGYASVSGDNEVGLYKTTDGSDSWEKVYFENVNSLFFSAPEKGWICVGSEIISTEDAGLNWETQYSNELIISDIYFTDSQNGWAVGQNGLIVHTNNGGITSINENGALNNNFKVYPNPTNGMVTLTFKLERKENVTLTILNSRGQEVKQISLEKEKGQIDLDCCNFSSGVYFINLQTEKGILTKKLIIE